MTTTLSPPIRIIAILGVVAIVAVGVLFFAHNRSSSDDSSATPPATSASTASAATSSASAKTAITPAAKQTAKPVKPRVVLLPNLPAPIARSLHASKVVVAIIYSGNVDTDRVALAQARVAAKAAHAGFAAVNVTNERLARSAGKFAGPTTAPPTLLIVKRPGRIVNRFSGSTDGVIVAQAAMNAGAGR